MTDLSRTDAASSPFDRSTGKNIDSAAAVDTAKLKLIFFLLSHSSAGGAQEIWINLAEGFRARGYRVKLFALYPFRLPARETPDYLPWNYVVPTRPKRPLAQLKMVQALVNIFKAEKPHYVLTAMPAANVMASLAASTAGSGTKVILSHHSPVDTHNPVLNFADGWIGSLKSVSTIVSVSQSVAASLDKKPGTYRAKRRTIRNALPPRIETYLAELSVNHAPRDARRRVVVATGRLAAQKNYPVMLRAAAHMPDVEVQIVGNGPDEAMLKSMAQDLGVADRVKFLGFRPREEALQILADGDVFLQPSLFEGHSLALVEAAKLSLPIIVSDAPVQVEGVTANDGTQCGIIVGTHDDRALATQILRLLDEPAYYESWMFRATQLGSEAAYEDMIDAYEDLVR